MADEHSESYKLTEEEEALVRQGLESEKTGIFFTAEEVLERARKRTKAWKEAVSEDRPA